MKIKLSTPDELRQLAFEIIRPLPGGELARVISETASMICLELPAHTGRLRSVSFSLEALRLLAFDAQRQVKVDYLQRDLLRSAATRESYRYPRQLPRLGRVIRSLFEKKFEKKRDRRIESYCLQ